MHALIAAVLGLVGPGLVIAAVVGSLQGAVDALTNLSALASLRATLLATAAACASATVVGAGVAVVAARVSTARRTSRSNRNLVLAASLVALAVPLRVTARATADVLGLHGLAGYVVAMASCFGFVAVPLFARLRGPSGVRSVARAVGFGAALVAWRALAEATAAQAFGVASAGAVARWRAAQPLSAAEAPAFAALQMLLCLMAAFVAWRLRPGRTRGPRPAAPRALDAALLLGAGCPPVAVSVAVTSLLGHLSLTLMVALSVAPWLLAAATLVLRAARRPTAVPSPPS